MQISHLKSPISLVSRLLQGAAGVLFLTLIVGCMGNYGNYNRDADIMAAFDNNRVPLDYRYYYYHSGSHPIAVVGVEKKYDAGSRMWHEVDPSTDQFKDMITWMWEDAGYHRYAARINDPTGEQVGIMYTSIREVAIKFTDDNRIVIMPHTPFLWEVEFEENEKLYGSADIYYLPPDHHRASRP